MLTQTRKVLKRFHTGDEYVTFGQIDEDAPKHSKKLINMLYLVLLDWQDMGYPEEITVAVRPGDKLNPDVQASS
jgi:hypothetical protein